ncbi:Protein takeout [Frankliniella fusca]|uniref:Protein takeout n=1 Tax=Frankliniella fusca TaxID=407009 RepID=A0AAE1H2V7_9NEOP|nr:Protein takeout [Frankliniella fusca]
MRSLLVLAVLVASAAAISGGNKIQLNDLKLVKERPEWLLTCEKSNPDLNECLRQSFNHMIPALARGIPELGVNKFEPLFVDKIGLQKGNGGVIINGAFRDMNVHGPSNATANYVRLDFNKKVYQLGVNIPTIRVDANYIIEGQILLLPLVGEGAARLNLRNVTCSATCDIDFPEKDGQKVMWFKNIHVDFSVGEMRIHLNNLFNGNKVLGRTVNQFLNKNSVEVIGELREELGRALGEVFLPILQKAFGQIPTRFWLKE